MLIIMITAF